MKLENWAVVSLPEDNGIYTPPEAILHRITGEVHNSPKWENGHKITTSPIDDVKGNIVTTVSGSVYELGEPRPDYVEFCRTNGMYIPTKDEPIKVHRRNNNESN